MVAANSMSGRMQGLTVLGADGKSQTYVWWWGQKRLTPAIYNRWWLGDAAGVVAVVVVVW